MPSEIPLSKTAQKRSRDQKDVAPIPINYDLEAVLQGVTDNGENLKREDVMEERAVTARERGERKTTGSDTGKQNKRNRARSERRQKKRALEAAEKGVNAEVKQVAWKRRRLMAEMRSCTLTDARGEDLVKAAEGSWLGSHNGTEVKHETEVQCLLERGFQLVSWDGKMPHAVLDKTNRVVVVLAGMPSGSFQEEVIAVATSAFRAESEALVAPGNRNTRESFCTIIAGFSHGSGIEKRPTQTSVAGIHERMVSALTGNPAVIRLARFQNQAFEMYFPDMHAYYQSAMSQVKEKLPSLEFPFTDTFPSTAFNLGPQTVCKPHRDSKHLPFGICCISALGTFDHTKGGHLVLDELKLVIEFPPGATVLIPSAAVTHSNTGVGAGETRYSFTQYAPGSLFAYVEDKMETDKMILLEGDEVEKKKWETRMLNEWKNMYLMFPLFSSYR